MNLKKKKKTILQISEEIKLGFWDTYEIVEKFRKAGLIKSIYN